ncbi:MAG: hypothetical protein AAF383_14395 [Cyanobacteria bacterium P01_A01_bin.83]
MKFPDRTISLMIRDPDSSITTIKCAIITVSDTLTLDTNKSGQLIKQLLQDQGHQTYFRMVLIRND